MFAVIFEVHPKAEQYDTYLSVAKSLRPESEQVAGYVENIRYRSLTRDGWILSLSIWKDEKALIRWRTKANHHKAQEEGRTHLLTNYYLRVGQITEDTRLRMENSMFKQRHDETEVGSGTTVTLVNAAQPPELIKQSSPEEIGKNLGLSLNANDLVTWDVFEAVLTPGDSILLCSWRTKAAAEDFEKSTNLPESARIRRVLVIRDYGMFDRREAPQYYPDAEGAKTIH